MWRRATAASLLTMCVVAPAAVRAGEVVFDPSAGATVGRDGNVAVVGEQRVSDTVGSLWLNLALSTRGPRSTWTFAYRPSRSFYQDNSSLDFTEHRLGVAATRTFSLRNNLGFDLSGVRSDVQTLDLEKPGAAASLVPRTTRTTVTANLGGRAALSQRSDLAWRVAGAINRYDSVPGVTFEDSNEYGAGLDWAFRSSERSNVGVGYTFQSFTFDVRPDTTVQGLGLVGDTKAGRDWGLSYRLGAIRSEEAGRTDTNPAVDLGVSRVLGSGSSLTAGARQSAGTGDGLVGATRDRGVYLSWTYASPRRRGFESTVGASWWRRDPLISTATASATTTLQTSERLGWAFNPYLSIGVSHAYTKQSVSGGTVADQTLATAYNSAGVGLTWRMRGERGRPR